MVAFDDEGRMLIAASGYRGGGNSRVSRIAADGRKTVLVDDAAFGTEKPLTSVAFHEGLKAEVLLTPVERPVSVARRGADLRLP